MELNTINPYVIKIMIAAREKDSINAIASRINLSYGWTYKWVKELASIGVFRISRMRLFLNKKNAFYKRTLEFIKESFAEDVAFYYNIIKLFGIDYCFTKTDAVFIWTKGGYNIGRYKGNYPIFIKIREEDKDLFRFYARKVVGKKITYKPAYVKTFSCAYIDDIPVDPLQETVIFMRDNIYNFEPALEMVEEMYNVKTGVRFKEVVTNV